MKEHMRYAKKFVLEVANGRRKKADTVGQLKLQKYAAKILIGLVIGVRFNKAATIQ